MAVTTVAPNLVTSVDEPARAAPVLIGAEHAPALPVGLSWMDAKLVLFAVDSYFRDAWEDLLAVMERAGLPISEKQRNYFLR